MLPIYILKLDARIETPYRKNRTESEKVRKSGLKYWIAENNVRDS